MTRRTYQRLLGLASSVLDSGWSVLVDAAFLKRSEREEFRALAQRLGVRYTILYCTAPVELLLERIERRARSGSDASDADRAVLKSQVGFAEIPAGDESAYVIEVDTGGDIDVEAIIARIKGISER